MKMEKQTKNWFYWVGILLMVTAMIYILFLIVETGKSMRFIGKTQDVQNTITVTGSGSVNAIPDVMFINLGFEIDGKTVQDAQSSHTQKMNQLISSLDKIGIQKEDIQTSNYNVYPQYNYTVGRSLTGYTVSSQVEVKVREFAKGEQVLALVGELGVNQVYGMRFDIDEPEELIAQAREKAIEEAQDKAKELGKNLQVKLGRVVGFNEYVPGDQYPIPYYAKDGLGGGGVASPTISPGENEVRVEVTVIYEIL